VLVIAVVALAITTSSFTSAPAAASSAMDDFALRHPADARTLQRHRRYAGPSSPNDPDFLCPAASHLTTSCAILS
jgi:hypothetical protein